MNRSRSGRLRCLVWTALAAGMLAAPCARLEAEQRALPKVVVLATGGTIAGQAPSETDARYDPAKLSVDHLIEAVPQVRRLARVTGEQVAQIASQDMTDEIWLELARRVGALLASDEVAGVVITHGTDTMEETAYFLNLVVHSDKPVVLTGAMRPSTALSADGALNLYNAVAVAADRGAWGRGVLLAMNETVHGARDVTKTHTGFVQTFVSPNRGPIGVVQYGETRWFRRPTHRHTARSVFSVEGIEDLPRVDIVYAHANMRGDLVRAAVRAGAKGIVVAGVGNGNMSAEAIGAMARAARKGVVVVRSTRTGSGAVGRNLEVDDDGLGFVASDGLNPQDARILLKLALTKTKDPGRIQQIFYEY